MIFRNRLIAVVTVSISLLFASGVPAQSMRNLDAAQMRMLQQMSPEERSQLLDILNQQQQSDVQQESLFVPELLEEEDPAEEIEVFDIDGNPIMDATGNPVILTEEFLNQLTEQSPETWYSSEEPFFEQDIRLQPFGYDLFQGAPSTFAPATDIPVPNEYKLGPGDTIDVQLFGKENRQYSLVVNREGTINFPELGPVSVIGQSFEEFRQSILDQVADQLIGTSASISLGALRSITVLIVGDARQPGSYTVSGLSTMTNALLVSGGVSNVGSLRRIQLKRNGRVRATLDLYDLLLRGDSRNDVRLESGDVIFVPPVGATVGVGGFVKRPAIYELRQEKTVDDIVRLAGGLRSDAYPEGARLERIDETWQRSFADVDLTQEAGLAEEIRRGDILLVPPVLKDFKGGVRLLGHVDRPGVFQWRAGARLTDLIGKLEVLQPQAELNYVLIRRELQPSGRIAVLSANLEAAITNPASPENLELQPKDEVSVFQLERQIIGDDEDEEEESDAELEEGEIEEEVIPDNSNRRVRVDELLKQLERQAGIEAPFEQVTVSGQVRAEGQYPYEAGMRVSDLIRAGGGFNESAYSLDAELTRYEIQTDNTRKYVRYNVDLSQALQGALDVDLELAPGDFLTVRQTPNWNNEIVISLEGEVRFPGAYTALPGDTLSSVIERAGGLTAQAFPEGSIFLRRSLRLRERQRIEDLRARLESDLAALSLQAAGSLEDASVGDALRAGEALLTSLDRTKATGRLVIDLPELLAVDGGSTTDVILQDGDRLLIPRISQSVTVLGEVQYPTSHLHEDGLKRNAYIDKSGGFTPKSAKKRIYVVRANGEVLAAKGGLLRSTGRIQRGDTIVVPLDTERGFRLNAWSSITRIVYNSAIAVAAIDSLGN